MARLLKPEPMQRTLILASKRHQPAVIETLHRLHIAHLVDYQEEGGEFSEFKLGTPLPAAGPASARLVRLRAILRHLGLEGAEPAKPTSMREIDARLDAELDRIEREVNQAYEAREHLKTKLQEDAETLAKLQPLTALPLRLEDYRGYDALQSFVGRADPAFEPEVLRAAPDALLVKGSQDGLFALFVPAAQAGAAQEALYRHGYAEVEVPSGVGLPAERIRAIEQERDELARRAGTADADLQRLAAEHRDMLLAAEEHLGIVVEKAEAPLFFASSANAFAVDAWIPRNQVHRVELELHKATDGNVYVELVETGEMHVHHQPATGAQVDAAHGADLHGSHHVETREQPPTKYANPRGVRRFQWFVDLFSTPRYNEIDPTFLFALFFPIFFGFMIGDLGLGLVMVGLGFLIVRKLHRVDGMKQLGTAILVAGVIAAALGGFVFKDALGMPLGVNSELEHHAIEGGVHGDLTCGDIYKNAHEAAWSCLFRGKDAVVHHEAWADPLLHKVTDVPSMLLLSVLAGLVHLLVGLLIGIRNEWGHGGKHLVAKFGYFILLIAFFPAAVALLRGDMFAGFAGEAPHAAVSFHLPFTTNAAFAFSGIGVLVGAVLLGWAEGIGGVLEIPSMFGAIMSYLRLGAVAIAKGAMAIAFNSFTIVAALTGGSVALVLGILGFLVAQVVLLVLGLLSGGIQALRLNFVEFFTKFYKGGGTPFKPFGRERRHTTAAPGASATVLLNQP